MSDVVNAELLRLCDLAIGIHEKGTAAMGRIGPINIAEAKTMALWIKSRLQAEAPTDAEVAKIEKRHRERQQSYDYAKEASGEPLSACGPLYHQDIATLLAKLRARTSQAEAQAPAASRHSAIHSLAEKYGIERMALGNLLHEWEAQAPTTAASVLTEGVNQELLRQLSRFGRLRGERHYKSGELEATIQTGPSSWVAEADDYCKSLTSTVGAPAPAPARERTLQTLLSLRSAHNLSQYFESGLPYGLSGYGAEKIADALIANGDTP